MVEAPPTSSWWRARHTWTGGVLYFDYTGVVKNTGTAQANSVRVYIYVYNSQGTLIENEWKFADSQTLAPQAISAYTVKFSDEGSAVRNQLDKSKTTYEIKWQ